MRFYPIGLDIKNKKVVIVGGGKIAERKARNLLPYKSDISLVSPDLTDELQKLAERKKISYFKKKYSSTDIKNAFLVFAATNDGTVNRKVFNDAKKQNVLVNVCDKTELCDFIIPAVIKKNGLVITVSSDGKNPKLSRRFKEVIENEFANLWNKL
ncbi:MAG: bifunctional precorrin-2 dehydrogenase/sirohydrochlorin ferrochelatase [Elusimicrobia bacterium]|nr:bifunctional precorrin-2 dehydrogenase/sirohydrochlorin ferrochelatase [Elusimicrobiota bacterium]